MHAIDAIPANLSVHPHQPQPIASWGRLIGLLLIGVVVVAMGFMAQHANTGADSTHLADHSKALKIYLSAGLLDWALLYFCWVSVRAWGGNLATLSGGRWTSWKSLATDLAIALPFWIVWEGAAWVVQQSLGPNSAKTVDSLHPRTLVEILAWIALSLTAGFCEELVFRGFLQRQLHALTGKLPLAVLGQGVVFGLFHAYQGWKNTVVISVLGILFGVLAAWRRNLRANVVVHAWADVWAGWVQSIFFK